MTVLWLVLFCLPAQAQDATELKSLVEQFRKSNALPFPMPMMFTPPGERKEWPANTVMEPFPDDAKKVMMQNAVAANPWSLRQVFNFMTSKRKVEPGINFDDVVEAMDSRAIDENLKKTGHSMIWKEIEAKTGEPTPRVEILQYCDAITGRMIMDYAPEFSIFLPCRISVLEDAQGDIWIMTLDWDISWLAFNWHPDSKLDEELKQNGLRIRNAMASIMEAGATGDW